jgi:hypothetical protein
MTTRVAALRLAGVVAALVFDGPMNGEPFIACIDPFVLPTLTPGDVVIMDNLSSHEAAAVRALVEGVEAHLMYLPPYSSISTRPRYSAPSTWPPFAKPKLGPSTSCGVRSATSSKSSHLCNAPTPSPTMAMPQCKRKQR